MADKTLTPPIQYSNYLAGRGTDKTNVQVVLEFLKDLYPNLVFELFADRQKMTEKMSQVMEFTRILKLNGKLNPISDFSVPAAEQIQQDFYQAMVYFYGAWVPLTKSMRLFDEKGMVNTLVQDKLDIFKLQMMETRNLVALTSLLASTNIVRTNGASNAAVKLPMTYADLEYIENYFTRNNVPTITSFKHADKGWKSIPINPCYILYVHPDTSIDLSKFDLFQDVKHYMADAFPGEIGKIRKFRIIETSIMPPYLRSGYTDSGASVTDTSLRSTSASNYDIYEAIAIGQGAFVMVDPMSGVDDPLIFQGEGSSGALIDPFKMISSVAWLCLTASKIKQPKAVYRNIHCVRKPKNV